MGQALKHVCLIFTLLAWAVFPLPECYLTKPDCPKRNSGSCQTFNHRQASAQAPGEHSPCAAACPMNGRHGAATPPVSNPDGSQPLMASLSPKFLLQESPGMSRPMPGLTLRLPILQAPPIAAISWPPARGGHPDPIPILRRTQTLLI